MSKDEAFYYELGRIGLIESIFYGIFTKLFIRKANKRWRLYQGYLQTKYEEAIKKIIRDAHEPNPSNQ